MAMLSDEGAMTSAIVPDTKLEATPKNIEVHMLRPNLQDLPEWPVPQGFSLRRGPNPEDWVAIQRAAEPFLHISMTGEQEGSWAAEFEPGGGNLPAGVDRAEALGHMFFLVDDANGLAVGTATAWRTSWHRQYRDMIKNDPSYGSEFEIDADGLIHWVAILPEYQGRGLSKPLLSAVLKSLGSMPGLKTATLGTGTARSMAIPLYLKAGFEPMVFSPEEREGWRQLREGAKESLLTNIPDERAAAGLHLIAEKLCTI
mmetsp:Transcript_3664/g.6548  ORF Transcript_3664/g.6548 Transcript_3664/m.6548 type:complete len:257 (+) Transcript_3664:17-787(+)